MTVIEVETKIAAPRERVFDLSRSIEVHAFSTASSAERAVAGVTSGLIAAGQQVTWEARHLGVTQRLTSRITRLERPRHFQDVMVSGAFRHFVHDHDFEEEGGSTLMRDRFEFSAPWGVLGWLAERLVLARYLRRFLLARNAVLKRLAESDEWIRFLPPPADATRE